ncbi:MAG: DNA polymerase [bacterium]|nr:DNA polymerase [bacterium]
MKTLLLIDANSLIHRTFHALPPLTAPDGRATQSLYGLSSILLRIFREDRPEYVAALFDRPEPTFRKEKYKEYKAQRPKAPDNLISQIIEAHTLFEKFGIRTFEKPGYEADDLIATLATKFSAGGGSSSGGKSQKDLKVVILTGDLDTLQIVEGEKLVVRTFRKGISDTFIYDEKAVMDRYGLKPKQLIDYKALVGDASDNIKGVPGVGEKTAIALLQKYGTLENVYKNLEEDPKIKKKLEGTEDQAEFSRSLVVLEKQAPIKVAELEELKTRDLNSELEQYFLSLGFESLVKRLETQGRGNEDIKPSIKRAAKSSLSQVSMFSGAPSERGENNDLILISEKDYNRGRDKDYTSSKLKIGFGLKNFLKEARKQGQDFLPPYFDLGVAFWLLDPDFKDYGPEATFKHFMNKEWGGRGEDLERAYEFCLKKLETQEQEDVFFKTEMPLVKVLAEMENFGIGVSFEKLKALESKIEKKLEDLTKEIHKLAGEEFNINSPKQLSGVLFEKLKLGGVKIKKTAGGAVSTREEVLSELIGEHPVIGLILEYREGFKLLSTYIKPFQDLAKGDKRIHTDYVQTGAATGRLSSREPNMQNIPKEGVWAKDMRSVFEAPKGASLLSFDYSQIELRVLAVMTGDKNMMRAFHNGQDIHALTASKVLGVPLNKVSSDDRRLAKTLNFGLIYGMGVAAFSKSSGLSRKKAQEFIETYFREFSAIRAWHEEVKQEARRVGYVKTVTGRRRYLKGLDSGSPRFVAEAERIAINMPLQGLAADITKMAMIKIENKFVEDGLWGKQVKMLLTIHDELLFEVPDDMIKKIAVEIREIMEGVYKLEVPLRVDISVGKNWGEMEELESRK